MAMPTQESFAMPVPMSYRQIADDLQLRIEAGDYAPGAKLPSFSELAALYSVSITTAQHAYRELKARGIAVGSPGRGIFVRDAN